MTLDEQVAVLTAIQKRAKELLDEIRPEMNRLAVADYMENGVAKREVRVAGTKVADLVVPLSAEGFEVDPDRAGEFIEFAELNGLAERRPAIREGREYEAMEFLKAERPDLVEERTVVSDGWRGLMERSGSGAKVAGTDVEVPGVVYVAPEPKTPTLRGLKWQAVAEAAKGLPGGVAGLLEG